MKVTFQEIAPKVLLGRFYEADNPPPMADYVGVCVVVVKGTRVGWVWGLYGDFKHPYKAFRALLQALDEVGIQLIRAHRAPGRRMPGTLLPDGTWEYSLVERR